MNISALNPTTPEGWFALGSAVFEGRAAGPDRYPPLDDRPAQRGWLAGFGASWIEASERHDRDPARYPPTLDLWTHLTRTLTGRPDLLRQLGAYRRGAQSWGDH